MTTTVSIYDFRNWFMSSDNYKNNFSSEGLDALFEYLEEYEESTGEQIEFDPIALCCEYTEYESLKEFNSEYTSNSCNSLEELSELTTVIPIESTNGSFIIVDF